MCLRPHDSGWLIGLLLVASPMLQGCLEDAFPPLSNPTPPSCGNDVCDLGLEDCDNCPQDCPCCSAISSASSEQVTSPEFALGKVDGNGATLGEYSSLILVIGREIFNRESGGASLTDFRIEGQVTSNSNAETINCASTSAGEGAFEVLVSFDGSSYGFVGLWTQENNEFDIGCAQMNAARFIQIRGLPTASASLDAITSESCLTNNTPLPPVP